MLSLGSAPVWVAVGACSAWCVRCGRAWASRAGCATVVAAPGGRPGPFPEVDCRLSCVQPSFGKKDQGKHKEGQSTYFRPARRAPGKPRKSRRPYFEQRGAAQGLKIPRFNQDTCL